MVEKPFGRDLTTAQALDRTLHEVFPEQSIFRIDHYLGKEAVQNLLYFRFANAFLEPIWNRVFIRRHPDHHGGEIRRPGPGRVLRGGRRDSRRGTESPAAGHRAAGDGCAGRARSRSHAGGKTASVSRHAALDPKDVVRGQFNGYRDEEGVAEDSRVETFAALRLHIDTWRWADVPSTFGRANACPPPTEVMVNLKAPPLAVFDAAGLNIPTNYFRFRLSPEVVICRHAGEEDGEGMLGSRWNSWPPSLQEREIAPTNVFWGMPSAAITDFHPRRQRRGGMARGGSLLKGDPPP